MKVTIEPLTTGRPHVDLVVAASRDSELVHNTYLAAGLGPVDARQWCAGQSEHTYVVRVDGQPAGLAMLTPGVAGVADDLVPARAWETETWMLAPYRNRGAATEAWAQIEQVVRADGSPIDHFVGIVWEANTPSHRQLARSGFWDAGPCWWELAHYPTEGGWCRMWVRCLHAQACSPRTPPE